MRLILLKRSEGIYFPRLILIKRSQGIYFFSSILIKKNPRASNFLDYVWEKERPEGINFSGSSLIKKTLKDLRAYIFLGNLYCSNRFILQILICRKSVGQYVDWIYKNIFKYVKTYVNKQAYLRALTRHTCIETVLTYFSHWSSYGWPVGTVAGVARLLSDMRNWSTKALPRMRWPAP